MLSANKDSFIFLNHLPEQIIFVVGFWEQFGIFTIKYDLPVSIFLMPIYWVGKGFFFLFNVFWEILQ